MGWGTKGVRYLADPPSTIRMGPQQAVAGGGTSQSGGGTGKAIHTILLSSPTQVLQLVPTSSCPRRPPTPQTFTLQLFLDSLFSHTTFSLFLVNFSLFLSFNWFVWFWAGWPNFFPASLKSGGGYFSNDCGFSVESSFQGFSSNLFLWF